MVQNEDLSLKFPVCLGLQSRAEHHHSFSDFIPSNLQDERTGLAIIPQALVSQMASSTFLRAKEAVWPLRTSFTGSLLRCIDLIAAGMKLPSELGPNMRISLTLMTPFIVNPETTVPTPFKKSNSQYEWNFMNVHILPLPAPSRFHLFEILLDSCHD